ncbi:E3 ubiquitin-protein ligase HERC2 [Symbiodinium microadriaticum]|uniref:E3 ubiquitin-protein ligase HERC2 n=1 Tax=Symbiodinium microadriaticum TaxID=2951 RepID=A0A1Q9F4P1_SYMMI|nr:E3 ubiquitin-protein ligase HERC2 [Symbiodinium microadriaticum]
MSIAVEVGLLSGKTAAVQADLDETVQTLQRRAQIALGAGKGRLLDSSGDVLDGCAPMKTARVANGDSLTLHVSRVQVQATRGAFAAILGDGSVVTWGHDAFGGDSRAVQDPAQLKNVQLVQTWLFGFAAILGDGSVVTWGPRVRGMTAVVCRDSVQQVQASESAFAAILADGSVVTWGDAGCGGDSRAVQGQLKNVQQVQASSRSFAAILADGSVVTWGDAAHGGDSGAVQGQLTNVLQVQASDGAFAAILGDGSVVTWGDPGRGGDSSAVQKQLKNVRQVQASSRAFAAILADGSVVTWGDAGHGGDSRAVQGQLRNVQQVQASASAFAAILLDGSVVTWGDADYGGDSSSVQEVGVRLLALALWYWGLRDIKGEDARACSEPIFQSKLAAPEWTGFVVKIVPKKHQNFIELVKTRSTHANALTNVPDILLMQGNCIPCALWHVVPLSRPAVVAAMSNTSSAKNMDAKSAGYRDYRSVASMCAVDLTGCLGLPGTHVKSFMLHYEGNGVPHSVAVRVDASGVGVTIIDGATVYKLNMATLREIHCAAVDHATILSYWKRDPQDKGGDKSATLLDMVAGAGDDPNDSDGDDSDGHEEGHPVEFANRLSFDDDNVPVFNDHILESLEKETNDVKVILALYDHVRTVSTRCHMAALDIATAPILVNKMETMNKILMDQVVDALTQNFSADQLRAVVHVGTDQPSEKLFNQMKEICPSMRSLTLDPIHLAIVYEYGFWNKRSPGSKQLRRILRKCITIDAGLGQHQWGAFYDGTYAHPLSEREMQYREMITDASMDLIEANNLLDGLDTNIPFADRLEFIKCLAALCKRYPAEVTRKIADNVLKKPASKRIHTLRSAGVKSQRQG